MQHSVNTIIIIQFGIKSAARHRSVSQSSRDFCPICTQRFSSTYKNCRMAHTHNRNWTNRDQSVGKHLPIYIICEIRRKNFRFSCSVHNLSIFPHCHYNNESNETVVSAGDSSILDVHINKELSRCVVFQARASIAHDFLPCHFRDDGEMG